MEEKSIMQVTIEQRDKEIGKLKIENAKLKHDHQAIEERLKYYEDKYNIFENSYIFPVVLNDEPIKAANIIIDRYSVYNPDCEMRILKQIAEHLLVYVNGQRE